MPLFRSSLFETVVVGAILAICVGFLLIELDPLDKIGRANDIKVQRDIQQLAQALDRYLVIHGSYPTGLDLQQALITTGELSARLTPPDDYTCGGTTRKYNIVVKQTAAQVSCELHSKRFTKLGKTHWVWCSTSGKAGPTNGSCP